MIEVLPGSNGSNDAMLRSFIAVDRDGTRHPVINMIGTHSAIWVNKDKLGQLPSEELIELVKLLMIHFELDAMDREYSGSSW